MAGNPKQSYYEDVDDPLGINVGRLISLISGDKMFDNLSYSDGLLRFHSSAGADLSGAITTVRLGGLVFTENQLSLGKHGPFLLPDAFREQPGFQSFIAEAGGEVRVAGSSKTPRTRPDWSILTFAYRMYARHQGIETSGGLPPALARLVDLKRQLWNSLCARCQKAIEAGQTIPAAEIDSLAALVHDRLTAFNDSLGRSKDKIAFPKDNPEDIPAVRVGAYARFLSRLRHLAEEEKSVPEGLAEQIVGKLKLFPYDWSHFRAFERSILDTGKQIATDLELPLSMATGVIDAYRRVFKQRRTNKAKGFDGIPHPKQGGNFDWSHEVRLGSGGVPVARLLRKGHPSVRLGGAVEPAISGHPEMYGLKAQRRTLRPVTFVIEGREVTFAIIMHRPLPQDGLLKAWRLVCRDGEYWVNFMLEVPPTKIADSDAAGVAGLDLNWRVLPGGSILLGMLADGTDDTMILFDRAQSPQSTSDGGMITTGSREGFRFVSLGVGPSRWGRNNLKKKVNYGIPDTFAGVAEIRQLRDEEKDALKRRIATAMGDDAPSYLPLCGARGLKELAREVNSTHPEVASDIRLWAARDEDICRVMRKAGDLLDGRIKRGYEQLAHHLCRQLSSRGVRRVAIEENFLKKVAESEKKYQPEALQKSQRHRQEVGASVFVTTLEHIGSKYGIVLTRQDAAYTTVTCRFCNGLCEFGGHRSVECPGCGRKIDQDQNAAHNLRSAEMALLVAEPLQEEEEVDGKALTISVAMLTPDGSLRAQREVVLKTKAA